MVGAWCLMPQVNNVVFAMIAATTVETNVAHPTIQQHTREFLDTFSTPRPASYTPSAVRSSIYNGNDCWHESSCYTADKTRILLTHVPLYRPPNTDCGDLRLRSRALRDGKGFSYVSQPNPHTHTHTHTTKPLDSLCTYVSVIDSATCYRSQSVPSCCTLSNHILCSVVMTMTNAVYCMLVTFPR
jgi:hypothetical protein